MNVGMYTGSFDPITRGHMDIIEQAKQVFDIVYIAVLNNLAKAKADKYVFTFDERVKMVNDIYKNDPRIRVIANDYLTAAQLAKDLHVNAFIRGLRNTIDFEYEKQMGYINKRASDNYIPTVCFFSSPTYQFVSSSVVRELMQYNPTKEQMNDYVYRTVWEQIEEKLKNK